ncbi:MAG: IS3 family transposase [Alphaproteobacteria bacterium]|nr:IS3 family transposase [Alphaproteobacteria bacterium]
MIKNGISNHRRFASGHGGSPSFPSCSPAHEIPDSPTLQLLLQTAALSRTALGEAVHGIKDEFEAYGWRRMQAVRRHLDWVVTRKKIKRLIREHGLQPQCRRRYVATTDSDHDRPIFEKRARDLEVDGPNQLWAADLSYITITGGFVYLAAVLDAYFRHIVGYALDRRIDARLTLAALRAAIDSRAPPSGCRHHSNRGSQYAAKAYRAVLDEHGLLGSMGRRGNPYDNAMMESFMKTLKVEGVYPMAFETADDVAHRLPRFIDSYNQRRLHSALGYLSPTQFEEKTQGTVKSAA